MTELETPRHLTFDADVVEGLAAPWPSWPVDAQPRPFDEEAATALALRLQRRYPSNVSLLSEVLPQRDGAVTREEAAFWFSLLRDWAFTHPEHQNEGWIRARCSELGSDPSVDAVLDALREPGRARSSHMDVQDRYKMRALRALVPWHMVVDALFEMQTIDIVSHVVQDLGYCPEEHRDEAASMVRRRTKDVPADAWFSGGLSRLYCVHPHDEAVQRALELAGQHEDPGRDTFGNYLLCMHTRDAEALDALIRAHGFAWSPRHVLSYLARRGMGDLDAMLEATMTGIDATSRSPERAAFAMLEHVKAPEVVARLYPHMIKRDAHADVAQRIIDEAVAEHAAHGLLSCCARAGKKRTWAIGQLRRLLARDGGREAIEAALETKRDEMVEVVRAAVLDHEDDLADVSIEDAPDWAKRLAVIAQGEVPVWVVEGELPALVDARTERALPRVCSVGLITLDDDPDTRAEVEGYRGRFTEESLQELSNAMMSQWFTAPKVIAENPVQRRIKRQNCVENTHPMKWVARHPSPRGVALLEDYVRSSKPPNRPYNVEMLIDHAAKLLCTIELPEALGAMLRVHDKARRNAIREIMDEGIDAARRRLGVTRPELEDMSVLSFGLDEKGRRDFDYGARTVRMSVSGGGVMFEDLSVGTKRKTAPRGLAGDDVEKVAAAHAAFDLCVKPIKAELRLQRGRFENAMITGRRWSAVRWREIVRAHPLLAPIAQDLVWEVWRADVLVAHVRPTEDGGLIDVDMDDVALEDDDALALAHPLEMGGALGEWMEHMLSFERAQPFDQLSRPTYALDASRDTVDALAREELLLDLQKLRKIAKSGPWELEVYRGSRVGMSMVLPDCRGERATLYLQRMGSPSHDALRLVHVYRDRHMVEFEQLDPVSLSEALLLVAQATDSE